MTHQTNTKRIIDNVKKTQDNLMKYLEENCLHLAFCVDSNNEKEKQYKKDIETLRDKVDKGFSYNKVMRRKTKSLYKYLENYNINKLTEQEAKDVLKTLRKHLQRIAYDYRKELFY